MAGMSKRRLTRGTDCTRGGADRLPQDVIARSESDVAISLRTNGERLEIASPLRRGSQ
jgi:hypothetical protein